MIISFSVVCCYLLTYDILEYSLFENCDIAFHQGVGNDLFWGLSRGVSMIFWVIPIVYIFWPKLKRRSRSVNSRLTATPHNKRAANKINNTKSVEKNIFDSSPASLISSLDEELSDDDEIYHQQNNAVLPYLTTNQSSNTPNQIVILKNKQQPNFNSLIFGTTGKRPSTLGKSKFPRYMSSHSHQSINETESS